MTAVEKELGCFHLQYMHEGVVCTAEVQVTDMEGWVLYECFILPHYSLVQIVLEEGDLMLMDAEEEHQCHAPQIMNEIAKIIFLHPN